MADGFDVVGPQGQYAKGGIVGRSSQDPSLLARSSVPQRDKEMAVEFRFTLAMVGQERDALKAREKVERALRTVLHEPALAVSATITIDGR